MNMNQAIPLNVSVSPRRLRDVLTILSIITLGVLFATAAGAVDLTNLASIGGPMGSALTQMADLTPGIKALVGIIAFVVAFISLAALRNFGPVLFYVGVMIFGAVGLVIGGAILGAVI